MDITICKKVNNYYQYSPMTKGCLCISSVAEVVGCSVTFVLKTVPSKWRPEKCTSDDASSMSTTDLEAISRHLMQIFRQIKPLIKSASSVRRLNFGQVPRLLSKQGFQAGPQSKSNAHYFWRIRSRHRLSLYFKYQ